MKQLTLDFRHDDDKKKFFSLFARLIVRNIWKKILKALLLSKKFRDKFF